MGLMVTQVGAEFTIKGETNTSEKSQASAH